MTADAAGTDAILLQGLQLMAICGALPEEKVRAQPFTFDIEVFADLSAAGASDELDDTIDYGGLTDAICAEVTTNEFTLMEHLVQRVADVVLADERVQAVTVSVAKDRPPVPHPLATSGVRITRTR